MESKTPELTDEEYAAMKAFRAEWPQARVRKYYPGVSPSNWKGVLVLAWMSDWREQWGTLRTLRNSPRFDNFGQIWAAFDRRDKA